MMFLTSKIMSAVLEFCMTLPLSSSEIPSEFGFGISFGDTRVGPRGQKVSKLLEKHHWPLPNYRKKNARRRKRRGEIREKTKKGRPKKPKGIESQPLPHAQRTSKE